MEQEHKSIPESNKIKMKFIFFTDYSTQISNYCLLNVKKYKDISKLDKIMYFIDPSVYELKHKIEYSNIKLLHEIAGNLKENEFISIDYPNDMNLEHSDLFIQKSVENNRKFANNSNYIATIQFKFNDFIDFKFRLEELTQIVNWNEKILGIGNFCRLLSNSEFSDNVFELLKQYVAKYGIKWIHFYGLGMRLIFKCIETFRDLDITISIDSTKWTKRINKNGILSQAICCRKETRNEYFLEYIREIERRNNIKVIY